MDTTGTRRTVRNMPTTPWIYRSPALAERIESLQVAASPFDQATIEARASYAFTATDVMKECRVAPA